MDVRTLERRDLATVASWFASIHDAVAWAGPGAAFPLPQSDLEAMLATQTEDGRACLTFAVSFEPGTTAVQGTFGIAIDESTKRATLARIALAPAMRGRGLGKELVRYAVRVALEHARAKYIDLHVFSENEPAVAAYLSCGFAFDGTSRETCVVAGRSWHLMKMRLSAADAPLRASRPRDS